MRVIAGKFKRRPLSGPGPKNENIRATYDRVRENVFNLLGERVEEAAVLDLFAGTGSIGIEAISRGAASVVFVDHSHEALNLVRRNTARLGIGAQCRIIKADSVGFLQRRNNDGKFDIIYIDPPYRSDLFEKTAALTAANNWLAQGGIVIGEHGKPGRPPATDRAGALEKVDTRKYGRSWLTLWQWAGTEGLHK